MVNLGVRPTVVRRALYIAAVLVMAAGCKKPPTLPEEPRITYNEVNKNQLVAGEDTLIVQIDFEDGDGDLGIPSGTPGVNAYLVDSRTGFPFTYVIPKLNSSGDDQAISGSIWFTLDPFVISCNPLPPDRTLDTFSFEIYIVDQKGNESNHVVTEDIYLQCP
jgi:hypothetical protein